ASNNGSDAGVDSHPIQPIANRGRTGRISADKVALHCIPVASTPEDKYAILRVSGNDVPYSCRCASNYVIGGAAGNAHAVAAIGNRRRAGEICANQVACYCVSGGAAAGKSYSIKPIT